MHLWSRLFVLFHIWIHNTEIWKYCQVVFLSLPKNEGHDNYEGKTSNIRLHIPADYPTQDKGTDEGPVVEVLPHAHGEVDTHDIDNRRNDKHQKIHII